MNTAAVARLLFSVMIACMLVGFTAAAQDKAPEKPKQEMKQDKADTPKEKKHHKGKKMKGSKEKKSAKKEMMPPK